MREVSDKGVSKSFQNVDKYNNNKDNSTLSKDAVDLSQMPSTNPVQQKIDALILEDRSLEQGMMALQQQYEEMKIRRIEISGSIRTLIELFQKQEPVKK